MQGLHIRRSPPQTEPQNPRSKVRNPTSVSHHEARGVRNEMQTCLPLHRGPTQPPVTHPYLERPRLPSQQRHPTVVHHRNLASCPTKGPVKAKRVMRCDQPIPHALLRHPPHRADGHIAERKWGQWRTIVSHHATRITHYQFRCPCKHHQTTFFLFSNGQLIAKQRPSRANMTEKPAESLESSR